MRLIGNKVEIIDNKGAYGMYWKEHIVMQSSFNVWDEQDILPTNLLTNSNYLRDNIYDEINRE